MKKTVWLLLAELLLLAIILVFRSHDYQARIGYGRSQKFEEVEYEIQDTSDQEEVVSPSSESEKDAAKLPVLNTAANPATAGQTSIVTDYTGVPYTAESTSTALQSPAVSYPPGPQPASSPVATVFPETDSDSDRKPMINQGSETSELSVPTVPDSSSGNYEGEEFEIP